MCNSSPAFNGNGLRDQAKAQAELDTFYADEDSRKTKVAEEMAAAKTRSDALSNRTLDFSRFVGNLTANTTAAYHDVGAYKARVLKSIKADNKALEMELEDRSSEIERKLALIQPAMPVF